MDAAAGMSQRGCSTNLSKVFYGLREDPSWPPARDLSFRTAAAITSGPSGKTAREGRFLDEVWAIGAKTDQKATLDERQMTPRTVADKIAAQTIPVDRRPKIRTTRVYLRWSS